MSGIEIKRLALVEGIGGFWVNDQPAIQLGAPADGFFFKGPALSPGFSAIREPSVAYCIMLELADGQYAYGDCVTVLNLGYGGRPAPVLAQDLHKTQEVLRALFEGRRFDGFRAAAALLDSEPHQDMLLRPIAFGMSQALLSAAALSARTTMARVLMREYGVQHYSLPGLAGSCGGNWKDNVDKAIARRISMFPQYAIQTREQCERLPEYVSWINARIDEIGGQGYAPDLHFDFHSSLGRMLDNNVDAICNYLSDVMSRAGGRQVYFEDPLYADTAPEAMERMAQLYEELEQRGMTCRLVADEWVNAPGEAKRFAQARAAHVFQIKTPDNGSLTNTIDSIRTCHEHGILPYLGGSCNETDISVRASVHVGMAMNVWRMFTRPGLGFDEGLMVTTNEMRRTAARLEHEDAQS